MEKKQTPISVELGEKEAEGIYSNMVLITHSPAEFILDFARVLPGAPKSKVFARIVMTPRHVKGLLEALKENVGKFEAQHGTITPLSQAEKQKGIGF
ncbi:MAG: DUF3467 domain-containing protein [Candidatus Eiseniibacteriota bacterium]|nr:MAG: DUF3467 domain-containing protein [Candidatus Eisenbacteria bacterium]